MKGDYQRRQRNLASAMLDHTDSVAWAEFEKKHGRAAHVSLQVKKGRVVLTIGADTLALTTIGRKALIAQGVDVD